MSIHSLGLSAESLDEFKEAIEPAWSTFKNALSMNEPIVSMISEYCLNLKTSFGANCLETRSRKAISSAAERPVPYKVPYAIPPSRSSLTIVAAIAVPRA
jgi:hypothetical protein